VRSTPGLEGRPEVRFRHLDSPEEFREVEYVQRDAWGLGTEPPVPATILRAFQDNGGLLLGAFDGEALLGFTMGFLGREGATTFHYSHMTAVRRAAQRRRLGYDLKRYQRNEVLAQGLREIRWTFDPLQCKNASLNVHRLGGRPVRYFPRYYGVMADAINAGLETDRMLLVWSLESDRVRDHLTAPGDVPESAVARWRKTQPLIETAVGPMGVRVPFRSHPPEALELNLEIPNDMDRVRDAGPTAIRTWREATRAAFLLAFAKGYAVDDVLTIPVEGEERCFYLLGPGGTEHES
jgi:predicted GNAT superfamily acetyltransferase